MGPPDVFRFPFRSGREPRLTNDVPGWGLVARVLKLVIDVIYVALAAVSVIMVVAFVAAMFVPLSNFSVTIDTGTEARQMPLSRGLLLFALGVIGVYFAGFFIILRQLRQIFASLLLGDPFHPANVRRLNRIGVTLALVTTGGWTAQTLAATHLAPGALQSPGISQLLTPGFAILIVLVLAEVFREGSRLRRESELTI